MTVHPQVFIICGVFNGLSYTKKLLSCIDRQTYSNIETIIVDDGSTDGTNKYIKKNHPRVTLLSGDGSLWWTGSISLGVGHALKVAQKGDFILTINNDCTFSSGYVDSLVRQSKENNRAIVGSLAIDKNDKLKIWDAGVRIDWSQGKVIALGPRRILHLPKVRKIQDKIDTLPTRGTVYPVEVFEKVDNFDKEHFPHYLSDYEFGIRAKKAGFSLLLSYESRVYSDTARSGLLTKQSKPISLKHIFSLAFSKKSQVNIIDHFNFIRLCCPKKYRAKNYLLLLKKIILSPIRLV